MKIAVIGCGYIGMELCFFWKQKGYTLTGTTTTPQKLPLIGHYVQKSQIFNGREENELDLLLRHHDVLVFTLAPKTLDLYEETFLLPARALKKCAAFHEPKCIIYTSNCVVYGEHFGAWVDETSPLNPLTNHAKILIEAEKLFLSLERNNWKISVLRLGDLYGPGRELSKRGKELEGTSVPGSGDRYTNFVHQEDVILAIDYTLTHHLHGIYNVVDDDHPTRKDLYDSLVKKFHLKPVQFQPGREVLHNGNKRVSNHKIKSAGFLFQHPHLEFM